MERVGPPTLQNCRNLESFVLSDVERLVLEISGSGLCSQLSVVFKKYHAEVERRKSETLKWEGVSDRRKTPRVTNYDHLSVVTTEE